MAIQPALGYLHHRHFVAHQSRGVISYAHIWYGRLLMAVGVINGGLGLQLAAAPSAVVVAYAVIAAVVFVCYAAAKTFAFLRARKRGGAKPHGIKLAEVSDRSPPAAGAGYRPGGASNNNISGPYGQQQQYGHNQQQQQYGYGQRSQRQYEQHEAEQAARRGGARNRYG